MNPLEAALAGLASDLEDLGTPYALIGGLAVGVRTEPRSYDRRPQDLVDVKALIRAATDHDKTVAREALSLITRRGFDRGRDLAADARKLLGP